MLDSISNLPTTIAPLRRRITGQYLAKNRLTARARARLAADILSGKAEVDPATLTTRQVAYLCRVSKTLVNIVQRPLDPFVRAWIDWTPEQQSAFINRIGTENFYAALSNAIDANTRVFATYDEFPRTERFENGMTRDPVDCE